LEGRGIAGRVLTLRGLVAGPGLAARARRARYAALEEECRALGLVDLLLGHHAGDQAETVLMRQRRGSGPAGLAGMAALSETNSVRLVRPLLAFPPERLRPVVAASGLTPADDPSNRDERWTRVRLRREIGLKRAGLLAVAARAGASRAVADREKAAELGAGASFFPEGYAVLQGAVGEAALGAVLRAISGRDYPVRAVKLRTGTRAGVQILASAGTGWLLCREPAAVSPPVPALAGAVWDGRFRVAAASKGAEIGALGTEASGLRDRTALPSVVLRGLPALRYNGMLVSVPHLHYSISSGADGVRLSPISVPAAGAPFIAC
jgi:tRNA(Ile)-lysidine synthase